MVLPMKEEPLSISSNFRNDNEDIVSLAVSINGLILRYVSPRLKMDRNIVKKAIHENGLALLFADHFLDDKEMVLKALDHFYHVSKPRYEESFSTWHSINIRQLWKQISPRLQNDKEVVLKAVEKSGILFRFIHKTLQEDKQVLEKALETYGLALKYTSLHFQGDQQIVMKAIQQNPRSILYASPLLRENKEIMKYIIQKDVKFLVYCPTILQNPEIFIMANRIWPRCLYYAPDTTRNNIKLVRESVRLYPRSIKLAHYIHRLNRKIAWKAMKDKDAYHDLYRPMILDRAIMLRYRRNKYCIL